VLEKKLRMRIVSNNPLSCGLSLDASHYKMLVIY